MPKERSFNKIIATAERPVPDLCTRYAWLVFDDKGTICENYYRDPFRSRLDISDLRPGMNIRDFFDLPRGRRISEIYPSRQAFVPRPDRFKWEENIDHFYTSLPLLHLGISRLADGRFAGAVTMTDTKPKFFEKTSGCVIYVDQEERLIGFSRSFYSHFRAFSPSPDDMLGKPLAGFLNPTPGEYQARLLDSLRLPAPGEFGDTPFRGTRAGDFLCLSPAVDLQKEDFRIEMEIEGAGQAGLMLGDAPGGGVTYPDINGYLVILDTRAGNVILKKHGYIMANAAGVIASKSPFRFSFVKTGNAFFLLRDGRCVFRYFDFDFLDRGATTAILYVRRGGPCRIRPLSLSKKESPSPPISNPDLLVSHRHRPDYAFLISRFDSDFLSSRQDLFGFRLHDITAMQKRVETLEAAYERERRESQDLKRKLLQSRQGGGFIGDSKAMAAVREQAHKAARTDATVLIMGPTGSGKEVLAGLIHRQSQRGDGPFVKVDCSVLSPTLMESQLFGHEKGAFTGADRRHTGLLEQADKGTLFLDELNNLTPEVQVKLLHFLQDRTILRVGGARPLRLDVRFVCASNVPLKHLVAHGRFREDLFYRIAVVTLALPPLRDRTEDLPALCRHFLSQLNRTHGKNIRGISAAAYKKMYAYAWPGNVRELKNSLERAVVFCEGETIDARHLILSNDDEGQRPPLAPGSKRRNRLNLSFDDLKLVLKKHGGIMVHAARELGISPRGLYFHLRRIGKSPADFREDPYPRGGRARG